jgi:hypothetical protein
MSVRGWMSSVLIAAVLTATVPAVSFAAEPATGKGAEGGKLHLAIARAATTAAGTASLQLKTAPITSGAKSGVRRQSTGGGHTMMIISMVTAVVGVGATVYAVKELNKTTKSVTQPQ